jgi:hypothetical protein
MELRSAFRHPDIPSELWGKMNSMTVTSLYDLLNKEIPYAAVAQARDRGRAPQEIIDKLSERLGVNLQAAALAEEPTEPKPKPFARRDGHNKKKAAPLTLPPWVREIKDAQMRNLVAQEWFVNPERAEIYAGCKNAEEIIALRKEYAEELPGASAMGAAWGEA